MENKLTEVENLFERLEKINKFGAKYSFAPFRETTKLFQDMYKIADRIPEIHNPKNKEELWKSQIKRRVRGEASYLEQKLGGGEYDFDRVLKILGISRTDIDSLKPWLEENIGDTQKAIERIFNSRAIEGYEIPLRVDIPSVRRQSEEVVGAHIQKYHQVLGKFSQGLTDVGEFLRNINAEPTTEQRSYFNTLTKTLAISIPTVCFSTEDRVLKIRERELIRIYGHEGMGHALNDVLSNSNNLPRFLKESSSLTISTEESLAQFYEKTLLENLRESPETQRKLGLEHKFDEVYQEAKNNEQLCEYQRKLFHYGISVMGDKSLGKHDNPKTVRKKIEILSKVAINKSYVSDLVHKNRYNVDPKGNLNSELVAELRYCIQPIEYALEEFKKRGLDYNKDWRSIIDKTFLQGFWTPTGFVDNSRLKAKEMKRLQNKITQNHS